MAQRVLIAAELESTRELLRAVLEHAGYEVCTAATSAQALACLQQQPQVIVLVVPFHDMPGRELFRLLKAHYGVPVLVLEQAAAAYEIPPTMLTRRDAYHPTPLKLGMLFRQLEALLDTTPTRQRHQAPRPGQYRAQGER